MKKIIRLLGILAIIGVVLAAVYFFAFRPNGYGSRVELTNDYITAIGSDDSCEIYFNPETSSLCDSFESSLDGTEIEVISVTNAGNDVDVVLEVDGIEIPFTFTFYGYEPDGLRNILTSEYYLIDTIR